MNIHTAISNGSKILKDNAILTACLDSEILMAKVMNKDRKYILLNSLKKISNNDLNTFNLLIKKRSLRKPVAQLTNKKFFWNSEFHITEDTLVPRPETELIVENVLKLTKQKNKLNIYSEISNVSLEKVLNEMSGKEYSFLKTKLTDVLVNEITPVGKEIKKLLDDKAHLEQILKKGKEKASIIAEENLKIIREKVGLI